jgi:curved DNA-binding protein CbpA
MKESLYGLLGIAQNASLDEIKTAYSNKMSMLEGKYDEASDVERKKTKWAMEVLANPQKKLIYDESLASQSKTTVNNNEETYKHASIKNSVFGYWWNTKKLTWLLASLVVLSGLYMYLGYKTDGKKIDVENAKVIHASKNESKHLDNEGLAIKSASDYLHGKNENDERAINAASEIAAKEQERRRTELEYRANAGAKILELEKIRLENQIQLEKNKIQLERENMRLMREQQEAARAQRQQAYYSCYNSNWSRIGDGARAESLCAHLKY